MKLVCIGDSLTFGYGVNKNENWLHLVNGKYNIQTINKGLNGDTTAGMLFRFYEDVILNKPEYVFIMGGTNDFLMNYSIKNVQQNIKELINDVKKEKIKIVLGIQPPIIENLARRYWQSNDNYEQINHQISEYEKWAINFAKENNFMYINFYKEFISYLDKNTETTLYIDGIHPTPKGHEIMAKLALKVLSKLNK
ncbi:SGNH/GDSL hydrolase family protein [Clostridium ganghwense]|uniref:SGNH/GDSL hydrolase family protein n=1 Tax=Clostridium ganghwense TaxID=312089 RepID=A0ABT4CSG8_9CLOT|nr:SGNH/GDSL hydrolase family protein [Clostridium ganghwense]MCY6372005.1 SGNH/GDSL hydrolase family protein [Clostridium ganghwense]